MRTAMTLAAALLLSACASDGAPLPEPAGGMPIPFRRSISSRSVIRLPSGPKYIQ